MPIRIPTCTVIVRRNGVNVSPTINKPFEFEADEVKDINAMAPHALRKPVNESSEVQSAEGQSQASTTPVGASSSTRGGKKTPAAASNSDTEL